MHYCDVIVYLIILLLLICNYFVFCVFICVNMIIL